MKEIVITSAVRTPIGSFNGPLSALTAPKLGAVAVKEAVKRSGLNNEDVDEVIMGNVLTAGEGQAPARQAALYAGLPNTVCCTTVNKVCGSGLKAVMLAAQAILCDDAEVVIAGGMESMSNAPYLLDQARTGYRLGHGKLLDSMVKDGLWDVYNDFHMGNAAEICSKECDIPRDAQDAFAKMSYERAQDAQKNGRFKEEIVPVEIAQRKGDPIIFSEDEEPGNVRFDKIPTLRPAFDKAGTVTAANASTINDGAAALVVMSRDKADKLGIRPIARLIGQASAGKAPEWFTTAPVDAIEKILKKTGFKKEDIDFFEVNEAFAVVALAAQNQLGIPTEKFNVNGGAVALGHPIGASGARILVTLLHVLKQNDAKRGLAAICLGGGEAATVIVERI